MSKDFTRRMALKIFHSDGRYLWRYRSGWKQFGHTQYQKRRNSRSKPTNSINTVKPNATNPYACKYTLTPKIPVILSNLYFLLETFFWFRRRKKTSILTDWMSKKILFWWGHHFWWSKYFRAQTGCAPIWKNREKMIHNRVNKGV